MSVQRKNSRRLVRLRRLGVQITGSYLAPGAALDRLGIRDVCPVRDVERDLYYVPIAVQRGILRGLFVRNELTEAQEVACGCAEYHIGGIVGQKVIHSTDCPSLLS